MSEERDESLEQLHQLRAIYQMNTHIAEFCFDKCVTKLNKILEKNEATCMAHCTARLFDTRYFITKRIVDAAKEEKADMEH